MTVFKIQQNTKKSKLLHSKVTFLASVCATLVPHATEDLTAGYATVSQLCRIPLWGSTIVSYATVKPIMSYATVRQLCHMPQWGNCVICHSEANCVICHSEANCVICHSEANCVICHSEANCVICHMRPIVASLSQRFGCASLYAWHEVTSVELGTY